MLFIYNFEQLTKCKKTLKHINVHIKFFFISSKAINFLRFPCYIFFCICRALIAFFFSLSTLIYCLQIHFLFFDSGQKVQLLYSFLPLYIFTVNSHNPTYLFILSKRVTFTALVNLTERKDRAQVSAFLSPRFLLFLPVLFAKENINLVLCCVCATVTTTTLTFTVHHVK